VAELQAPRLELGERAIAGARREARRGVLEQRLGGERGENLLRVLLPVGRDVQVAAGREPQRELAQELGLEQPALVVPLLGPGIGKEHVDAGERARRDHRRDDLDRVVTDHAQIGERVLADLLQQAAHARRVHLDAQEVDVGHRAGDARGRLAHATADLEHPRRGAAEHAAEVDRLRRVGHAEARQQRLQRALLRRRHPALPQHVAADRTVVRAGGARRRRGGGRRRRARRADGHWRDRVPIRAGRAAASRRR
jgi:hypothetical protein